MGKIASVLVICAHLLSVSAFIPAPSLLAQRTIRVVQPSGLSSVYCLSEERRKALLQVNQ